MPLHGFPESAGEVGKHPRTRLQDLVVTHGEVDRLLGASHRIHELGNWVEVNNRASDVAIEIARSRDGSLVVFRPQPRRPQLSKPNFAER